MAKRKDIAEGQKWAFVQRRNDLHDDCYGDVCTIAPQPKVSHRNDVRVLITYRSLSGELVECSKKIQLWQLKELWETFEPKKEQAWVKKHQRFEADQKARKARAIHEEKVAAPARRELARLLQAAIGGYVSDWDLRSCFKEDQITKLTALLVEHGVSTDKAVA
jgi:hypothetical protein